MASSNAETDVTNANASNEQQVMSPVPDLVTNVPSTTNEAHMPTVVFPSTSNSPASTDTSHAPVIPQPSPSVKHTATATTKTVQPSPAPPRATSAPSAASEASVKNRLSREDKFRKKDDKSVDHVLRALNSLNTAEEKLAAMCKKYADMFDEHRKLQLINKQTEKKCCLQQREKEQLQAEHSKAILTRSRLENLCRELQRQNKAIKDESLLKIREEEEKRKEVSAKFQTTMNEITTLMQQNNDKNMKLRDDNIDMTTKLKNICEQYELRQQQVERISKQMQLEQQLADAKLSKLKMEMAAEREMLLQEKKQLLMELQQYQQRCTEFQATEVNLRNQISMYNDKYDEFQKALARSNDVFGGFKGEMEKMSKKICKLEKETSSWKQRWERSHNALLEMGAEKQKSEQELAVVSRQLATLQGLCRTLQTERSSMLAKLKIFQAGGHEPLEKSAGNLTEKCHKQSEQSVNHRDQPCNHIAESNKVLDLYAQDIMASFQATENTPAVNSAAVTTESASTAIEASVPSAASPLPDVVGATNMCVFGQNADLNSALCERLENVTLEPSPPVLVENSNVTNNVQPSSAAESSLLTLEENLSVDQNVEVISNQQSVIVENLTQVVLNGDAHTNGSPPADLTPEELKSQPLKSPVAKSCLAKSGDSGKKTKESIKKKKK